MNSAVLNEDSEAASCCGAKFTKLVSFLNLRQTVHPIEPIGLEHSEFLQINNKTKIRILHVKPENIIKPTKTSSVEASEKRYSTNRNSLSEEYWFTRWNKPLKMNNCNCSFRKSQRYSRLSEQFALKEHVRMSEINVISSFDSHTTKIVNAETFVERLIQDTLYEAFHEYYMMTENKTKIGMGIDNFAYQKSVDDVDGVVLRRKKEHMKNMRSANCTHSRKKSENKPLIILLHGIGSTADVWWNIINTLLSRGFEVAAPDMLGHGYSSAPNRRKLYRFKKLLDHTLSVFDHFAQKDENRKFIIIGHSFGCSLATALSRYRSQQIVQLVLISGGGPTALSPPVTGNEISVFSCLQLLISPLLFCGMKRSLFYSARGKHFKPCDTDSSIPKYVLDYINMEQNWPEGDAAFHRRILIPTLLVHGLKDTEVTLVQECEMERTIPRAFLELIPSAGHMSILETPEQLSHMILCFVDWWAR